MISHLSGSVFVSQQQALWDAAEEGSHASGFEFRSRYGDLENVGVKQTVVEIVVNRYLAANPQIVVLSP
jgi:hypothetical protein